MSLLIQQEQQRLAVGTRKRACHFCSPGGIRRRPHRATSGGLCLQDFSTDRNETVNTF